MVIKAFVFLGFLSIVLHAQMTPPGAGTDDLQKTPTGDFIVQVEGMGRNAQEAMINAKRAAVEKGIGTFIQSETEIKNYMVSKDVILTRTMGAVKSVQKLSESTGPDGAVTVKIRATVSASKIHDDLAALRILLESMEKPRVMVMIKESNIDDESLANKAAETEIIRYLTEKEFELVDPAAVEQLKKKEQAIQAMQGNAAAAAAIGAQAGAEMIITGTAVSRQAEIPYGGGGMKSGQADVSVKVIVCATAKIVSAKTGHGSAVHLSPKTAGTMALTKGAKKVMDDYIFEKIVGSWQDIVNNGLPLRVVISNVKSFKASKGIIKGLRNVSSSVVNVKKRAWNQGTGIMELEVLYKGNSDGFSESMDGHRFPNGARLAVTGNTPNSVRMKVTQ